MYGPNCVKIKYMGYIAWAEKKLYGLKYAVRRSCLGQKKLFVAG
jgi:hypothetical protein